MIAYGCPADLLDETLRMAKGMILDYLRRFVKAIREVYGSTYLRKLDVNDIAHFLRIEEARGFPGMLGSIDFIHCEWRNCPIVWNGTYTIGDISAPTLMLEAVASQYLWIWHAFFRATCSNNDLNALNQSPLFTQNLQRRAPPVNFQINSMHYNLGYFLANGIYGQHLLKQFHYHKSIRISYLLRITKGARKDVERALKVLQSRFAIFRGPIKIWDTPTISDIVYACIILHNIIVEDERDQYQGNYEYDGLDGVELLTVEDVNHRAHAASAANFLQIISDIHNGGVHQQLRQDLVKHI